VVNELGATMAVPGESPDEIADRADRLMYMSKRAGRNRVTTDAGPLAHGAERPILGTAIPWGTTQR